jgi:hypothetical protein
MKRHFIKLTALTLTAAFLTSGCATIFGRSSYPVSINTNPAGAQISITDKKGTEVFKGISPATVKLKSSAGYFKKAEYQVKLNAPGHLEQVVPINYKLNGWYFGNILLGGLIGMLIVDPASGAMYKLDTPPINVQLARDGSASASPELRIININELSPELKQELTRIN